MARLIIVDDHRMFVDALSKSLAGRYEIAAVAHGGRELLQMLRTVSADCLLLDVEMPERNGYELIPPIRRLQPSLRILMVSMLLDTAIANAALTAGARGYVPKDASLAELCFAIDEVIAGRLYVSPLLPRASHCVGFQAHHAGLHRLTPRQEQILLLLGEGMSPSDACRALGLSPSTITFHKHNIMRVLGIEDEAALVRYAVLVRTGSIEMDAP